MLRAAMQALITLFEQHSLLALFLGVLCEQLGAPLPSLPFLLLAGVQLADGRLSSWQALAVATAAALLANTLWYLAGRRLGRRVLTTLCRISISPDSCVRQNELSFARRGVLTLLVAKFVPGLTVLAPPLAGALGMRWRAFLLFDMAGTLLWVASGLAAGLLFHEQIGDLLALLDRLGQAALGVAGAVLAAYVLWRVWRRWHVRQTLQRLERVQPQDLAARLQAGRPVLVVDVRACSPELPLASRIPGALHLDLSSLDGQAIADWPVTAEIVTYCACPNDASAAKAAQWLIAQGRQARVLAGGIDAWSASGQALEQLAAA